VRKRHAQHADPEYYAHKRWCLGQLEALAERGEIALFYGDETHVSSEGYVPYAWQFPDESVAVPSAKGYKVNIFGMISRTNSCHWMTTTKHITAACIADELDRLSLQIQQIQKETVLVLDNASVHRAKSIAERRECWQRRGLHLFFLPPYSPHLNIAETLWRVLKGQWLDAEDYRSGDALGYAVNRCMASVGRALSINFSPSRI
jgi:hypothetical protein